MPAPIIGVLDGPYDKLVSADVLYSPHCHHLITDDFPARVVTQLPVGRLKTYFTYSSRSENTSCQKITIADFSQALEGFTRPDPPPETLLGRLLSWSAVPTSPVGQRTSHIEIPRGAQYAMHPDKPLFAYNGELSAGSHKSCA